jgi:hypothetical protein
MTTTIPTLRAKKTPHQRGREAIKEALNMTKWEKRETFTFKDFQGQFDVHTEASIIIYMRNIGAFQFQTGTWSYTNPETKMSFSVLVSCGNVHIFQTKSNEETTEEPEIAEQQPQDPEPKEPTIAITEDPMFLGYKREFLEVQSTAIIEFFEEEPTIAIIEDPMFLGYKCEVRA